MSYRRENDRLAKLSSKSITTFAGSNYAPAKTDQFNQFAFVTDLNFFNKKPVLREGLRKNSDVGYTGTVTALMPMSIGGENFMGVVTNGILSALRVSDVLAGERRYYVWRQVAAGFHWDEVDAKTWNELRSGN